MFKALSPLRLSALSLCLGVFMANPDAGLALDGVDFRVTGPETDIEAALRTASALLSLEAAEPEDVFAAARAEYGRLIGALYALGHYSPVISVRLDGREAASIPPLDAPVRIGRVEVSVNPGPVFRFSTARVAPLAPGTDLPEGFREGEIARSELVRAAVEAGIEGWRDLGHAKARVAGQSVVADHLARGLAADIRLSEGPRLRFGPVAIEGNQRTRENRVRKIAGLPEGEVFSPREVERAAQRLRRTGTFRSVMISEDDAVTSPDLLGMTVSVVEEKPRRLSFGAEISSLDGLDLSAVWMHRNILGGAERLRIEGAVSQIGATDNGMDYRLGLTIDRPATLTPDTTLRFSTEYVHEDDPDFRSDGFKVAIGFSHFFRDDLTGRVDLAYEQLEGEVFGISGLSAGTFRFRALTLPIGLTWDRRDSATDPTRGFYVDGEVKPFLGFGTTGSGLRAYADLRAYRGFGDEDRFVLAGRVQAGAVFGSDLLETPRDDLFLSGGSGSVRGQPYQSLGVLLARGPIDYQIGGNRFLAASLEARVKVTESIGVVGFVDAGRIDVGAFFDAFGEWHAGAGLGLRYDTAVGPIRLDVAAPVHGRTGDGVQIYVGLGQAF